MNTNVDKCKFQNFDFSCPQTTSGKISCAFNIIDIPKGDGRSYRRSGVCTGWIDRLTKGMQRKEEESVEGQIADLSLNELPKVELVTTVM